MNPVSQRVAPESRAKAASIPDVEPGPKSSRPGVAAYFSPGQKVADRYEVLGVLGEGGMGVVYRCRDHSGEVIALKRVVLPLANADEHLGWFLAEAQALAALCHDNIVKALDFGQLRDGTPYLAMELVEGTSMQQLIAEPPPFALLWLLTDQVLAALAHAHARGIVHGDLKPSNVVVEHPSGQAPRARLFDFGLAKRSRVELDPRLGQRVAPSHPPPSAGTPGYMAPEQILGRRSEICPGTDLYALGCILYRALSGKAPFPSENRHDLDFHCYRDPDKLVPQGDVPEGVADFVMRLLRKRPWDRAASAAEVRAAWKEFQPKTFDEYELRPRPRDPSRRDSDEISTGNLTTRRISPRAARTSTLKLRRSNQWLPGLLSIRPSPLVGRTALCRQLLDRFEQVAKAPSGARRAVVLTGPAGVGKTRLADWLCTELEESGSAITLRGARRETAGRDPLALALSERYGLGGGALRLLPVVLRERCSPDDLGSVVDWILRRFDPPTELGGHADERTALSLLRVLDEMAGGRPLVLSLEDPTELSPETLAMLGALPRRAPAMRVLVLITARPETLGKPAATSAIRAIRAALDTEFVTVPPLDSLTTSAMLRSAHPIDSALALQIALESEGIPLDALSRLFALAKRGRIG